MTPGGSVQLADLNILPLLEHFGGAPGKVTNSRRKPAISVENSESARENWLYDYR